MKSVNPVQISGVGCYVPDRVLTNHDLAEIVDTDDEWILQRTGISERRLLEKGKGTSDMAVEAVRQLCLNTGLDLKEIELLIVATVTPDMFFPSTACLVQDKLGIPKTWGFDLSAACCGFVYGLSVGHSFVAAGIYSKVVVVGADKMSGIVDYTVGPAGVKIFVLAEHPDPKQRHYLNLYKMGEGPLYPFWVPYHLVHFEAPNAIARVVLFGDNVAPPLEGPVVEVCAVAKRDLAAGEVLDEYGMYTTYGEAVNAGEMNTMRYLPEGLVEGCELKRAIAKDQVLTYDDVELPRGRLADRLRAEQYRHFFNATWLEEHLRGTQGAESTRAEAYA